jgi:hypothetical protein
MMVVMMVDDLRANDVTKAKYFVDVVFHRMVVDDFGVVVVTKPKCFVDEGYYRLSCVIK